MGLCHQSQCQCMTDLILMTAFIHSFYGMHVWLTVFFTIRILYFMPKLQPFFIWSWSKKSFFNNFKRHLSETGPFLSKTKRNDTTNCWYEKWLLHYCIEAHSSLCFLPLITRVQAIRLENLKKSVKISRTISQVPEEQHEMTENRLHCQYTQFIS